MSSKTQIVIKAWMLPVIVIALVVPGTAAFLLGGPGFGLAVGALTVGATVVVAALKRPDEPIEVARSGDARRRLLLVATEAIDRPAEVESVMSAAEADSGSQTEVLVLAPAVNTPLSHWASDIGRSRLEAQRKLVLTIGALAAARVDARGAVGDPDPLQAVEDTLREFAADEVIVAAHGDSPAGDSRRLVSELRRRLDLPVYRLEGGAPIEVAR